MPKNGINISPQVKDAFNGAFPVFSDPASVFQRGPGGILPERGSQNQRDMVALAMQSAMQAAPQSGSPLLAFMAPMLGGAVGARTDSLYQGEQQKLADQQRQRDQAAMGSLAGMMGGGQSGQSTPRSPVPGPGPLTEGQQIGSDTRAALGMDRQDWLRYANDGATRNQPLSSELTSALSFLPEMGITMEVFSGGQPAAGSGGARVGSTRHDHGSAADVFFYKDGRRLDWSNPQDVPVYQDIVRRARAAGVTGFGAGEGYMQPGSMHIGFGSEAVWGAGGSGANAPDWLRAAYNGQQGGNGSGGAVSPELMQMMTDPALSEQTRSVASMVFESQMEAMRPPSPKDRIDLERANVALQQDQIELAGMMRPPDRKIIEGADNFKYYEDTGQRVLPGISAPDTDSDADVTRQANVALQSIEERVQASQAADPGKPRDEVLWDMSRDPTGRRLLEIAGINPDTLLPPPVPLAAPDDGGFLSSIFGGGGGPAQPQSPTVDDPLGLR